MTDPINSDVKEPEGVVTPTIPAVEPLPGQPEPKATDDKSGEDKTVPLAALHEERTKRQEMQAELEALRSIAGPQVLYDVNGRPVQIAGNTPVPQASPQATGEEFSKQLDSAWDEDPRRAVEMTVGAALQWRDDVDAKVDAQEAEVGGTYQDYETYRTDIRKYVRALPINQRSNPKTVEMAYFMIKGQKSGNSFNQGQKEALEKIRKGDEVTGLTPGTVPSTPAAKGIVLSQEQLNVASMMNLSPEEYASSIKK